MGFYGTAHEWKGQKAKFPKLPKFYQTQSKMIKRGTVKPYLKKI